LRQFIRKGEPQFEPSDLVETVRHVLRILSHEIDRERIELQVDLPSEPLTVYADRIQIEQVVVNLIDNALKHSPAGTVVRVYSSGDADHLDIEVHNAGRIAPELMTRLFDPFTKGDPSSTASRFSAGLGLYIAREIAEAHGGTIDVQSSREEGTTFRVRLPRNPRVREERESGWAQTA